MFITKNPMKEKLKQGKTIFGVQLRSHSASLAEILGSCGVDYIRIETEHYACNEESIENAVRAINLTGVVPCLRIPTQDPAVISHMLDIGIMGIVLPHVDSPEEMRSIWAAAKFPPVGHRGASFSSRAAGYGIGSTRDSYYAFANEQTAVIPMIESRKAVENIEAILDEGVDILRIGRNDLSDDMGIKMSDPEFKKAERAVIDAAERRGIAVGTSANSLEEAKKRLDEGYRMMTYGSDMTLLTQACRQSFEALRKMAD